MKIQILTTGGTFECADNNGAIDITRKNSWLDAVADEYNKRNGASHEFDILPLMKILSENLTAANLSILAKYLLSLDFSQYDGFIITCGSDTLAYIASFVGLLACRFDKVISIVAANYPMGHPDSNGYDNFECAVRLIETMPDGVYVPYRNLRDGMLIHSATDIMQAERGVDFYSYHGKYISLGSKENYIRQTIPDIFDNRNVPIVFENVMLIRPYALMDYKSFDLNGKRAVLHTLYHSNTLDSAGAISLMKHLGYIWPTPMFLLADKDKDGAYRSFTDVVNAGAIPLYDISPECAYMKLVLACSQYQMKVREFMEEA